MSEYELWTELGNFYTDAQSHEKAIHAYQKAIQLDGRSAQSYSHLAATYTHLGRHAEAIPLYQKAIELLDDPAGKASLWNQLGDAYHRINDFDNAVAAYRMADSLNPVPAAEPIPPQAEEPPLPDPLLENVIPIQGGILPEAVVAPNETGSEDEELMQQESTIETVLAIKEPTTPEPPITLSEATSETGSEDKEPLKQENTLKVEPAINELTHPEPPIALSEDPSTAGSEVEGLLQQESILEIEPTPALISATPEAGSEDEGQVQQEPRSSRPSP